MQDTHAQNTTLAQQQAAGLRALADMIEQNPSLAEEVRYCLAHGLTAFLNNHNEPPDVLETTLDFGGIRVRTFVNRGQVCERVVTGTETVTEEVPDPEVLAAVPTVTVTREVEKVEWVCRPLLANDAPVAVA